MCLSSEYGFIKNTLIDNTLRKIAKHDPVVSNFIKFQFIGMLAARCMSSLLDWKNQRPQ